MIPGKSEDDKQSLIQKQNGTNLSLNSNYKVNFAKILEEQKFEDQNVWQEQFILGGTRGSSGARRMSAPSFQSPPHDAHASFPQSNVHQRSVTINPSLSIPTEFEQIQIKKYTNFKRIKSASAISQGGQNPPFGFGKSFSQGSLDSTNKKTCDHKYLDSIRRDSSGRRKSYSSLNKQWSRHVWNITIVCLVIFFFFGPWVLNAWIDWGYSYPVKTVQRSTTIVIDSNIAKIYLSINGSQPPEIFTISPDNISKEDINNLDNYPAAGEMIQPGLRFPLQQVLNQSIWQNCDYSFTKSVLPAQYFPQEIRSYHTAVLNRDRSQEISSGIAIAMDRDSKEYILMLDALEKQGSPALIVQNTSIMQQDSNIWLGNACPQFDKMRLFIAVTTRCCADKALERRDAIRNTWLKTAKEMYGDLVTVKFVIAQPPLEHIAKAHNLLEKEAKQHNDIFFVPGLDSYRNLPNKTLRLLQYALSSPCDYTHIMKTDDDVYIRMTNLMQLLHENEHDSKFYTGSMAGIDRPPGQHGFQPVRNTASKWYVSYEELPEEVSPTGVPYAEGWGYILARDGAAYVLDKVQGVVGGQEESWAWWGHMPWEDVMIGAILRNVSNIQHCTGFKSAWGVCTQDTIVKHLDVDSPNLLQDLYEQENNGIWDKQPVVCNAGDFQLGSMDSWRRWRNQNLPFGQLFLDNE